MIQIQNCSHVTTQSLLMLLPNLVSLNCCIFIALPIHSAHHQIHACMHAEAPTPELVAFTLSYFSPYIWNSLPRDQALSTSTTLFLHEQTQDISLLRIFQPLPTNPVLYSCSITSLLLLVCTVCLHVCIVSVCCMYSFMFEQCCLPDSVIYLC